MGFEFLCDAKKPIPERQHDIAVIAGSSPNIFDDLDQLHKLISREDYDLFAINFAANLFDKIDQFVSIDLDLTHTAIEKHGDVPTHTWVGVQHARADYCWRVIPRIVKMSSILAMAIAINMGYKLIILVGCGFTKEGHAKGTNPVYSSTTPYPSRWDGNSLALNFANAYKDNFRSFSGLTKETFGKPTQADIDKFIKSS